MSKRTWQWTYYMVQWTNVDSHLKCKYLLHGTLQEKIQTMKQFKLNKKKSEIQSCDPLNISPNV